MKEKRIDSVDLYVGNRVRTRRSELGISQERLGAALRISFQQVQKYEKGMNRISSSRLQQISQILQVPIAYFFERAPGRQKLEDAPSSTCVSEFLASSDGLALAKAFMTLKRSKLRRHIVNLVRDLAGD